MFFSDDGGTSWVFAQPNVPKKRLVPSIGDDDSAIVDVTAMASRLQGGRRELLLATTTVEPTDSRQGRVVLSRDGGWTWTGRGLCGLPEGAIWAMAEAGEHVYATVDGHGVFVLAAGSYTWSETDSFAYVAGSGQGLIQSLGAIAIPSGFVGFPKTEWRARLNPHHLAVVRDGVGKPRWLVAGLVVDGQNRDWNKVSRLSDSAIGAGLWRLELTGSGLPAKGATWTQIAGINVKSSFPNTWRAVTGVVWDGATGVVASTEESAATGGKAPWFEGAVLWCEDVGAPKPVFRLVLTHPKATAVTMAGARLFVGLGMYDRIGFFETQSSIPAWQPRDDKDPLVPHSFGKGYSASELYFKHPAANKLSQRSGPVGVFEVRGDPSRSDFRPAAPLLPTQDYMEALGASMVEDQKRVDEGMKDLGQDGGWLSPQVKLIDMTGSLVHRNLTRPLALKVIDQRLFIGLMGSGSWSMPV